MKITLYGKQGHAHTVAFKNFLRMAEVAFDYKTYLKMRKLNLTLEICMKGNLSSLHYLLMMKCI